MRRLFAVRVLEDGFDGLAEDRGEPVGEVERGVVLVALQRDDRLALDGQLRVQAVLKRSDGPPGSVEVTYGPFRFDKNSLKFYLEGHPVELTSTEFKLLLFLTERAGKAQDRNDLLRTVWGYSDEVHSRTLDTHMKRLRQKLGEHAAMVETVRGIGYCVSSL